jgi:hypothetical protein
MKGVSLAIETIIVIILAVSVLTVMLFFFRSNYTPAETIVQLITKQNNACSGYVFYDYDCDGESNTRQTIPASILQDIAKACDGLNNQRGDYPSCAGASTDNACVKECCRSFCGFQE